MDPVIEGTSAAEHTEIEEISDAEPSERRERTLIEGTSAAEHTGSFRKKRAIQFSLPIHPVKEGTSATEDPHIEKTSDAESTENGETTHWPENSIFRVPEHIRSGRESNFEPKLVSIGPYYHGQENFQRMEDLKLRCITELQQKAFLVRNHSRRLEGGIPHRQNQSIYNVSVEPTTQGKRGIDDVALEQFMNSGEIARGYYKQKFDHSTVDFVRMLVIDSCFIIRIILSLSQQVHESMAFLDVHIKDVKSDLFLLENQIPLFFMREVYEWHFPRMLNHKFASFNSVLEPFISLDMPWRINHAAMSSEAAHLLDLYWRCSLSPRMYKKLSEQEGDHSEQEFAICAAKTSPKQFSEFFSLSHTTLSHTKKILDFLNCSKNRNSFTHNQEGDLSDQGGDLSDPEGDLSEQEQPRWKLIDVLSNTSTPNNATELHKPMVIEKPMVIAHATELHKRAGVEFEKFNFKSHLDVIFSNGIMQMPRLKIDRRQTTLLVNVIAFENCILPSMRNFSYYMKLMDALIDSKKDVKLLQKCGVIYNTLSSHEMAATFFNDIGNICFIDKKENHFSGLYKNVKKYYDSSWHRRWASLRQNYFSSPWAGISVIAGGTLLILSGFQTYYTIYGYYKTNN